MSDPNNEEFILLVIPINDFNISTLVDGNRFKTRMYLDNNKVLKHLSHIPTDELPIKFQPHVRRLREVMNEHKEIEENDTPQTEKEHNE